MAEEIIPAGGAPSPSPVAAEPAAPAAQPIESAPAAPVVEAVPPAESSVIAEAPEPAAEVPAEKPAETPAVVPEGEAPKAEGEDGAPAVAAPIVYEDFKLPEGFQAAPEQITAFTGVLSEFGLNQEQGQKLMDLHAETLKKATAAMAEQQQDAFAKTQRTWREDFYKTAGNRADTMANDARRGIALLVPDAAARKELLYVIGESCSGVGNHKALIGAFASAARKLSERGAGPSPQPTPRVPGDKAERRYNNTPPR